MKGKRHKLLSSIFVIKSGFFYYEEIKEADDNDVTQDTPFVPVTDDLRDDGIKRIREAGGKAPKDSFRGSLREGDNAYDLIISDDKI